MYSNTQGCYVKDLARLDRDIAQTIIVDNSPLSFLFQPQNAIGCSRCVVCLCLRACICGLC